ncbi:hypothetical protein MP638_000008 [Amoeboaphelidium occidentale]|nr:hypothetical protein MP638_000008 [Amoeboaphelidium occidentale]
MTGISLGLDRISSLLAKLGNPHLKYPVVHVAGTNGKGTTVELLSVILREGAGLKVGQYTSPHFITPRDCVRINGKIISKDEDESIMATVKSAASEGTTPFELRTAWAFMVFEKREVDIAVVEVGMGGLMDATNVFHGNKLFCVITNIDFDHQSFLGDTIKQIASHKAGIIVDEMSPVVVGPQKYADEVKEAVMLRLNGSGANVHYVDKDSLNTFTGTKQNVLLRGQAFMENFTTVVMSFKVLKQCMQSVHREKYYKVYNALQSLNTEDIFKHIEDFRWPGRMEFVSVENNQLRVSNKITNILLDGAHNIAGATALRKSIDFIFPNEKRITWIFGMTRGKDPAEYIRILTRTGDKIITVPFEQPDEMPWIHSYTSKELANMLRQKINDCDITEASNLLEPLNLMITDATDSIYVVTGSLYMLAEFYQASNLPAFSE